MSVDHVTCVLIACTTIGLLVILYTISAFLSNRPFCPVGAPGSPARPGTGEDALAGQLGELATFNHDWAAWDDTYAFVQDGNPRYVEANLMDETFVGARLDLMILQTAGARWCSASPSTGTGIPPCPYPRKCGRASNPAACWRLGLTRTCLSAGYFFCPRHRFWSAPGPS